jgi:hypothetical protein
MSARSVLIISLTVTVPFMVWVGLAACVALASHPPPSVYLP